MSTLSGTPNQNGTLPAPHHALPLTHADQVVYSEAAQRATTSGDDLVARALDHASRGGSAIVDLLRQMNTQLESGDVDAVAARVRALLQPIDDLDRNEPILTTAVADLAGPVQTFLDRYPGYQLPAVLLTDDAALAALDEQLLAIEDQVQEVRRRVEERRRLLAGRDLAGTGIPSAALSGR
ncbi:MAG TPA: hypothetical protein VFZ66_27735 [Herpetosiphonaceae bacterium]